MLLDSKDYLCDVLVGLWNGFYVVFFFLNVVFDNFVVVMGVGVVWFVLEVVCKVWFEVVMV